MSISSPPAPAPASGSAALGTGGTPVALRWGGLLRAELRRLRLRRFVVLAVLAYLAVLLFALGAEFLSHAKDNGGARAQAQQTYDEQLAACRANPQEFFGPGGAGTAPPCEELFTVESFYFDRSYRVAQALPDAVTASAGTFAVVAFVLGASAVGAEWSARTLPALLVWEPRRVRVLLTKLLAVLLVVLVVAVVVQALTVGAGVLTGHLRGSFAPPAPPPTSPRELPPGSPYGPPLPHTGSFWAALTLQSARALSLALVAAGIGFAVAAAARSTAAALGAAFGYFAVVEIGLSGFRQQWQPWLLTSNAFGWMQRDGHRITLPRPNINPEAGLSRESAEYTVHLTNGETGLYLLVAVVLALALATWIFCRRDLT